MTIGSVHSNGEAIVPVRLRGRDGKIVEVLTVLDTGFNDWLTLSRPLITQLGLSFREEGRYALADGSETTSRLFVGEIEWFNRWRRILIVEMDGGALLGMAALQGLYLGVEVIDGGRVDIRPLE